MDLNRGLDDLVAVALVAALAPLVVAALPGPRIPQVVIFLVGGVLIGPHVLGLAETSNIHGWASFLLSNTSWIRCCCGNGRAAGDRRLADLGRDRRGGDGGLAAAGYIKDYVPVGLALTPGTGHAAAHPAG